MSLRKTFLIVVMFGVWTSASGQSANLLKNPSGDEGSEHWRAFKDAKVEHCPTGGRCFVLRGGGYFIQDVVIPEDAVVICDGIEIRFYAAPSRSSNNNYISLTDTSVETAPVPLPNSNSPTNHHSGKTSRQE